MELNNINNLDRYNAIKDIPDKSIDLIITDPPYLIENCGGEGCFGKKNKIYHAEYSKLTHNENFEETNLHKGFESKGLNFKILDELVRVMKKVIIYI